MSTLWTIWTFWTFWTSWTKEHADQLKAGPQLYERTLSLDLNQRQGNS